MFIFYIVDFNNLFYKFHLLVFNNNFWILDPKTDNLINFFPESFFDNALIKIFTNSLIMSFGFFIVSLIYFFKNKFIYLN